MTQAPHVPSPGENLDLRDPAVAIDLFDRAAHANLHATHRKNGCVELPRHGRLLMTGDLHDHGPNFLRILKLSHLNHGPENHLVLHEVIHGPNRVNGLDLSIRILVKVAALKCEFPDQVHFLQSNHELSQLGGAGISKDGVSVVDTFNDGVDFIFGDDGADVRAAAERFIRTFPLAVRCANGIFCCHSLPSATRVAKGFDTTLLDRVPTDADLHSGGAAYEMVWGRNHNKELLDRLGELWHAKIFLVGHQPADMGFEVRAEKMMILASNHEHGVALPIDLSKPADMDALIAQIIPLAAVVAGGS